MAYPSIESTSNGFDSTAQPNHICNLPAGRMAGNIVVIHFAAMVGATAFFSITPPTGWTELIEVEQGLSAEFRFACFYRVLDGTEADTVTATTPGKNTRHSYICYQISGYNGTPEISTVSTQDTANPDAPSLTPSWGSAPNLWIVGHTHRVGVITMSALPAGYSDMITVSPAYNYTPYFGTGCKNATAASDDPGTFTLSTGTNMYGIAFTFAISGSAGGSPAIASPAIASKLMASGII